MKSELKVVPVINDTCDTGNASKKLFSILMLPETVCETMTSLSGGILMRQLILIVSFLILPLSSLAATQFMSFDDIPVNANSSTLPQSGTNWIYVPYAYWGAQNLDMWINNSTGNLMYRYQNGSEATCGDNTDHMGQRNFGYLEIDDQVAISGHSLKYNITGGYSSIDSVCPDYAGLNIHNKAELLAGTGIQHANRVAGAPYLYFLSGINTNPNSPPQATISAASSNASNNRFSFYVKQSGNYLVDQGAGHPDWMWQIGPWANVPHQVGQALGGHLYSQVAVGGPGWAKIQIDNHPNHSNVCSNNSIVCIQRAMTPANGFASNMISAMYGFYVSTNDYKGRDSTPSTLWFDEFQFEYDSEPQNEETINNVGVSYDPDTKNWQIGFNDKYGVGSTTLFKSTYELRYSFSPITNANWNSATQASIQAYPNFGLVADSTGKFKRVSPDAYVAVWAKFKLASTGDENTFETNKHIYFAVKDISQDPNNLQNINPALTGSFAGQGRDYAGNPTIFYDATVDANNLSYIKRIDYLLPTEGGGLDTISPIVTDFVIPTTSNSLTVSVVGFIATDNVGVTGYMITDSPTAPTVGAVGWFASAPTTFTFSSTGSKTVYAWAKDSAGNVSTSKSANTTITLPDTAKPVISAFATPSSSNSLTVSGIGFIATDNVGVTGYMITEIPTAPSAGIAGWSASAPTFFTFSAAGPKTAYAWAKDAAGNVSASLNSNVTITLPDVTAPVMSGFIMPTTSNSLVVSVTSLSATDAVGVTGYIITESATAPIAGAVGWSATVPTSFTFSAAGSKTAYAWAKDAAGNVSASASRTVVITLPDVTAPVVSVFTMPSNATSLTVSVSSFTATDEIGVTGYMITENSTVPTAGASGWSATVPTNFTFSAAGTKMAYAWAKDAAGNVSAGASRTVTITLADVIAPVISAFTIPSTATSLTVAVSSLTATDATGVTGYMITENSTVPTAGASGWSATVPTNFAFSAAGTKMVYAWAKDAAGNVSAGASRTVTITLVDVIAPVISAFIMPATATSLTVSVSSLTATDATGVTGYMITENSTAPTAGASGWSATAPTTFTFSAAGSTTVFAWAKDAAGNVSAGKSALVTITLSNTVTYSIGDALQALRIASGKVKATSDQISRLDVAPVVNGKSVPNGTINSGDVTVIMSKLVGKSSL